MTDTPLTRSIPILAETVGLLQLDETGMVRSANEAALRLLGLPLHGIRGTDARSLGRTETGESMLLGDLDLHMASPLGFNEWERESVGADGKLRLLRLRLHPNGREWNLAIEDVTDRRLAESRYRAIMGSSRDGILLVDEGGIIHWPNSRFGWFFGMIWRQFRGLRFEIAVDIIRDCFAKPDAFSGMVARVRHDPDANIEENLEIAFPRRLIVTVHTRPISSEHGRQVGRVWTFTDITRFKELEQNLLAINLELENRVEERTRELRAQHEQLQHLHLNLARTSKALEDELDMAKQVQQGLMPRRLPVVPGWEIDARYLPTGKVGGDFYDALILPGGKVFLLMADVSGHGVPAALVAAMARMVFQQHLFRTYSPHLPEILRDVNDQLCSTIDTDHYLTAFAALLDPMSGYLVHSRVCHPYPLLARTDGRVETITHRGGFFLGMMPENSYEEEVAVLAPGDTLLLYTDGFHESFGPDGTQFGRHRLEALTRLHSPLGPAHLLQGLLAARDQHANGELPADDITLLAIRRT